MILLITDCKQMNTTLHWKNKHAFVNLAHFHLVIICIYRKMFSFLHNVLMETKVANGQLNKWTPQCKLETISVAVIKCKAIDTFADARTHTCKLGSTRNAAYMRPNTRDQLSHRDAIGAKVHRMEWHMTATERDIGRYESVSNSGTPPWEIKKIMK